MTSLTTSETEGVLLLRQSVANVEGSKGVFVPWMSDRKDVSIPHENVTAVCPLIFSKAPKRATETGPTACYFPELSQWYVLVLNCYAACLPRE